MSTALGTTIQNGGETGTVDATVRPIPDTIPDNPATLAANTSIETLEHIMYRDWVWRNNFTVDSGMLPGHVFGTIKVHPRNCNDYITHISQMFLSWTGSFKIRTRFMATFQFGGSLRVGFLPPKFTEAQVQALPIQTLTAYPNVDLDPKNTAWTCFQAPDERNVLFHWMDELDADTTDSFGGYFVFYVASPLVVTGGSNNSISLLVEAAGNFEFSQLAPITAISPSTKSWIDSDYVIGQTGADDGVAINGIQILPANIKTIRNGFWFLRGLAGNPVESIPNIQISDNVRKYITSYHSGNQTIHPMVEGIWEGKTAGPTTETPSILGLNCPANAELQAYGWMVTGMTFNIDPTTYDATARSMSLDASNRLIFTLDNPVSNRNISGFLGPIKGHNSFTQPIDTTKLAAPVDDATHFANTLDGESIVGFVNTGFRTFNLQTTQHRQFLNRQKTFSAGISQIYQLRKDGQETPLLTLRLTPYGLWTTRATDVVALLSDKGLYLTYLQDLPMTTPIPTGTYDAKFLRYAGRATAKQSNKLQWDVNCYSLFK